MRKKASKEKYIHSKQLLILLLFEKDYISIVTIADKLFYSKSSVSADIPHVKRIIARNTGAILKISSNKGIHLDASENVPCAPLLLCNIINEIIDQVAAETGYKIKISLVIGL